MLVKVLVMVQCSLRQMWQLPTPCATPRAPAGVGTEQPQPEGPWAAALL